MEGAPSAPAVCLTHDLTGHLYQAPSAWWRKRAMSEQVGPRGWHTLLDPLLHLPQHQHNIFKRIHVGFKSVELQKYSQGLTCIFVCKKGRVTVFHSAVKRQIRSPTDIY